MSKQGTLRAVLRYEPESGRFFWVVAPKTHPRLLGTEAGGARGDSGSKRYWIIKLDGKAHKRSRLAFLWMTGELPEQVDHINGNSLDDRWVNLRAATAQQNSWNVKRKTKPTGLPLGVSKTAQGRYRARVTRDGVVQYLGVYETPDVAHAVYVKARKQTFGEWA
jgi:hypothetical protein